MAQIYIDGLGYRDPIKESGQIIWYLKNRAGAMARGHDTKYWLDLLENYGQTLLKMQAYEVYAEIKAWATDEKVKRREQARVRAKEKAEKEIEHFKQWNDQWRLRRELIKTIGLN